MTVLLREDVDLPAGDHRAWDVFLPTRYRIEVQRVPTEIHPGDHDHPGDEHGVIETTYRSWGVWDTVTDDWAPGCEHFDSKNGALVAVVGLLGSVAA